jgi:hypothetical protein
LENKSLFFEMEKEESKKGISIKDRALRTIKGDPYVSHLKMMEGNMGSLNTVAVGSESLESNSFYIERLVENVL